MAQKFLPIMLALCSMLSGAYYGRHNQRVPIHVYRHLLCQIVINVELNSVRVVRSTTKIISGLFQRKSGPLLGLVWNGELVKHKFCGCI